MIRLWHLTLAALIALAGCTGPLFCPETGTFEMGSDAAYIGRPPESFTQYAEICAKAGRGLDRSEWDRGYVEGLKRYCTTRRAYRIGFDGYGSFAVDRCPAALGVTLAAAYTHGEACGEIQEDLDDLHEEQEEAEEPDSLAAALVEGFFDVLREEMLKNKWNDLRCY